MCRCDRREAVEDTREISTKCGLRKCRTGFMKSSGLTGLTQEEILVRQKLQKLQFPKTGLVDDTVSGLVGIKYKVLKYKVIESLEGFELWYFYC